MGSPPSGASYWPMYVRGEAYLRLGDGAKAAAEYQKILDHRGIDPTNPLQSPGPTWIGTGLRAAGRQSQSESGLPGLLCDLERCRPRCTHPERCQSRIRQTPMNMWGGHSCPPPLNLILVLTDVQFRCGPCIGGFVGSRNSMPNKTNGKGGGLECPPHTGVMITAP